MPRIAENLNASVAASQQEVAAQLATASGLDAKLMALLGFMASVAAQFSEQLLSDLGSTIVGNSEAIRDRRSLLTGAVSWAVLSAMVFGLVAWLS